jgi:hypothetical protein
VKDDGRNEKRRGGNALVLKSGSRGKKSKKKISEWLLFHIDTSFTSPCFFRPKITVSFSIRFEVLGQYICLGADLFLPTNEFSLVSLFIFNGQR